MPTERKMPASNVVMAGLFIAIAAVTLWDTTSYTDADSYVFPRTIAVALIVLSLVLIVQWLLGRQSQSEPPSAGSTPRRVALVVSMLAATAAMPWIGFLVSGVLAFAAVLVIAMYDPWTRFRTIVYPVVGLVIVGGFYLLFREVLQVPLPVGSVFSG